MKKVYARTARSSSVAAVAPPRGDAARSNPHVYGEGEAGEVGRNLKFALTSR